MEVNKNNYEEIERLKVERDRYKAALEDIKAFRKDWSGIADELQQIAKKALKSSHGKSHG